jgi:hypothetical protein
MMELLNLLNLIVTFGLLVLIWIVQILHYPLFSYLAQDSFSEAMAFHQKHIFVIVMPLMLIEAFLAIFLVVQDASLVNALALAIVLFVWTSTFLFQVPLHKKLLFRRDDKNLSSLIKSNWIRTILWSAKFILLIFYLGLYGGD